MLVLGLETSCDETAAAVLRDGRQVLSDVVSTQVDIHHRFGGVVPEIASRNHLLQVLPVVHEALTRANVPLQDIDAYAVTSGPGLLGALLVGLQVAKSFALAFDKPLVGVNHLELKAGRMDEELAADRHAPGQGDDEAADGIDVVAFILAQDSAEMLIEDFHLGTSIDVEAAVGADGDHRLGFPVMLVGDLAHDLLDDVFDRQQPIDAAVLVDHERHVRALDPHLQQQLQDLHRRRHEQHLAQDLRQLEEIVPASPRQHVLDVHHADDIVERIAVNGQAGMTTFRHPFDDVGKRGLRLDGDDIGARNHRILGRAVAQPEHVMNQHPLILAETCRGFLLVVEQFAQRQRGVALASPPPLQAPECLAEPTALVRRPLVSIERKRVLGVRRVLFRVRGLVVHAGCSAAEA